MYDQEKEFDGIKIVPFWKYFQENQCSHLSTCR